MTKGRRRQVFAFNSKIVVFYISHRLFISGTLDDSRVILYSWVLHNRQNVCVCGRYTIFSNIETASTNGLFVVVIQIDMLFLVVRRYKLYHFVRNFTLGAFLKRVNITLFSTNYNKNL